MAKKIDEKILKMMTLTERFKYINEQKRIKYGLGIRDTNAPTTR